MRPFKLLPAFKDYIWGGENLKIKYGKKTSLKVVAESWELSAHKDGHSAIISEDSRLNGMLFFDFFKSFKYALGTKLEGSEHFPILIKLIEAKNDLSIQVHPNDYYALANEGYGGKTEMWYVLDCESGANVFLGLNRDMTADGFRKAAQSGAVLDVLNKVRVKKGDVLFIEPGTIHAINKGLIVAEIQQNSNLTYRIYDYARKGADGKARELHIDKALAVLNKKRHSLQNTSKRIIAQNNNFTEMELANCEHFKVREIFLDGKYVYEANNETFASVLVLEGLLEIVHKECILCAAKGESLFIPACEEVVISGENACFLITTV